ncbi:MAG: hypothetical protein LC637_05325, partial [Xanthomonadaceae bacterium]|nr:hypothetical protein [Xanthomonadaceae bacterium]
SCSADALISQELSDFANANTSDVGVDLLVAENFTDIGAGTTVSTGEATAVTLWGLQLELDPATGFIGPCGIDDADFIVTSWTNDAGLPGAVIDTQTITPTVTDTGIPFALGANIFEAQLAVSPALNLDDAGFVSVQREASPNTMAGNQCLFLWVNNTAGVGDNNALQIDTTDGSVTNTGSDSSVCVEGTGDVVPVDAEPTDIAGFTFEGSVTGISGTAAWASDMQLIVANAASASAVVGGFDAPGPIVWDFDGAGSTDDGAYNSDHSGAFAPGADSAGGWTVSFANDWAAGTAVQCWTGTVVTFIRNNGTETEVSIPDQCYAGGESQVVDVDLAGPGPMIPEAQAVPVDSFWALSLMALMLAGFGVFVIRRMA